MVGYEELTPEQLMILAWLAWTSVLMLVVGWGFRSVFNYMTAGVIQFRIEKEVATNIADKIALKKTLFEQIKIWWAKRKEKKVDPFDKYVIKPIEEV